MTIYEILHERLLTKAGLTTPVQRLKGFTFDELYESEWSHHFEELMHNRMVMGAFRYGLLSNKRKVGKKWDLIGPIKTKAELYEQTGNIEYLVDIANYCMIAAECDGHPKKHFQALDDHHDHCKTKRR